MKNSKARVTRKSFSTARLPTSASSRLWIFSSPVRAKEDLLVPRADLQKIFVLRRILAPMGTTDAIEFLIDKLKQTKSNAEFFDSMNT
ncbi:hypothetical protein VXQ18_13725 [Brucella abortus]|nr:hypothetical protein [Brucella abortus]